MKKVIILALAVAAVAMGACSKGGGSLKTEHDSLSYYLGVYLSEPVKGIDSTANLSLVMAGLKDALNHKDIASEETAYNYLREYMMVRKPLKNKTASAEFMAKVEKETKDIKKTESGILYVIEREGTAEHAVNDADQVRVFYRGTLPNGDEFDSSYARNNDTVQFSLNQVIPGWREGIKLVGKGGKIKMWLPSDLAYGEQGGGPKIGPNQAIVFEVELIDVIPAEVQPEAAAPVK